MSLPWEEYQSAPAPTGDSKPWEQYAPADQGPWNDYPKRPTEDFSAAHAAARWQTAANLADTLSKYVAQPLSDIPGTALDAMENASIALGLSKRTSTPLSEQVKQTVRETAGNIGENIAHALNYTTAPELAAGRGVGEAVGELAQPQNLITLPALAGGGAVARGALAAITMQAAHAIPEQASEAGAASVEGTPEEKGKAFTGLGLSTLMVAAPLTYAALSEPTRLTPPDKVKLPGFAGPGAETSPMAVPKYNIGDRIPNVERDEEGFADFEQPKVSGYLSGLPPGSLVVNRIGNVYRKTMGGDWWHDSRNPTPGNSEEDQGEASAGVLANGRILRVGVEPNPVQEHAPVPPEPAVAPKVPPISGPVATGTAPTETAIDPEAVPKTELAPQSIKLSPDVPSFKLNADPVTGVAPGTKIEGPITTPITVWQRLNGDMEVVTGRGRLQTAKDRGDATIPVQIVKESDGFNKDQAITLDAEANIHDNTGRVEDTSAYFRNSPQLTRADAESRGLLSSPENETAWDLGRNATPDVYSQFQSGKISQSEALAATRATTGGEPAAPAGSVPTVSDGAAAPSGAGADDGAQRVNLAAKTSPTGAAMEMERPPTASTPLSDAEKAALQRQVGEQAGLPPDPSDDTYGIAERIRKEREAKGQTPQLEPGEGVSAAGAVQAGRDILTKDPAAAQKAVDAFNKDKSISFEGLAAVRAKGEEANQAALDIERSIGTDSPEYRAAFNELAKWDDISKDMQTEWHKTGQAQQGTTDVDTGTFTGLQRELQSTKGRDFTPDEADTAKKTASGVKKASESTQEARDKLNSSVSDKSGGLSDAERAESDRLRKAESDSKEKASILESGAIKGVNADYSESMLERLATGKISLDDFKRAVEVERKVKKANNWSLRQRIKAEIDERVRVQGLATKAAQALRQSAEESRRKLEQLRINADLRQAKANTQLAENPELRVWAKAREYLQGNPFTGESSVSNFDDLRAKIATDLGMTVAEVTKWMAYDKRTKYLANDLWRKQRIERGLKQQAKQWIDSLDIPGYKKAWAAIPKILFIDKVGFHGTVALGTHAAVGLFKPLQWGMYFKDFIRMYRMVGSSAYTEMTVQDMQRSPNYTTFRRAGLGNDVSEYEDYTVPQVGAFVRKIIGDKLANAGSALADTGNRGYSILKVMRQEMADKQWAQLPKHLRTTVMAEKIADGINHSTGYTRSAGPPWASSIAFAPRLLASQGAWLLADPAIAMKTGLHWLIDRKSVTPEEKEFATRQFYEKATVAATYMSLLALNQGVLTAMGSDKKINGLPQAFGGAGFNPLDHDFMKFKIAGMDVAYGSALINMARLPVRLFSVLTTRQKRGRDEEKEASSVIEEFARSKLAPGTALATDVALENDWQKRPLPANINREPRWLVNQGVAPYTWREFLTEAALPIPFEEGAKQIWKTGFGMSDEQVVQMRKALATIAIMSATGARISEDSLTSK